MKAVWNFEKSKNIIEYFLTVRSQTMHILSPLSIEDYVVQTDFFMSPPRWHLGHVSWFYEQLLRKLDTAFQPYQKDYSSYLNSYYQSFGEPFDKGRRGTVSRPTVSETLEYSKWINARVSEFLERKAAEMTDELRRLFFLAFHHEYQHQELLVYDVQHLLQDLYRPASMRKAGKGRKFEEMIRIPGGIFEMGYDPRLWGNNFCYDIEMPVHKVFLEEYLIDAAPVSNRQYLDFIEDGGYQNFRFWLSDGWEWVRREQINAPLYWEQNASGQWSRRDFRGKTDIEVCADEPVTHISYYEADAYARWAGKRLPTEAEWEKAAAWDEDAKSKRLYPWGNEAPTPERANLLESGFWSVTAPGALEAGKSFYGCYQMMGDMWEWTQSEFMPYPRFKSGFDEYNDKWFGNQKVLRGGSFGTPMDGTRNTYRNFFRPPERWLISGFRCAKNA